MQEKSCRLCLMFAHKYVSLYITFNEKNLKLLLLSLEKKEILSEWEFPLSSTVPVLPKSVETELLSKGLNFNAIRSIYLVQKPIRWNSNRLVATFVRIVGFAFSIVIYNLNLEKDSFEDVEALKNKEKFWEFLKKFKEIHWKELKILYNSCSITNT